MQYLNFWGLHAHRFNWNLIHLKVLYGTKYSVLTAFFKLKLCYLEWIHIPAYEVSFSRHISHELVSLIKKLLQLWLRLQQQVSKARAIYIIWIKGFVSIIWCKFYSILSNATDFIWEFESAWNVWTVHSASTGKDCKLYIQEQFGCTTEKSRLTKQKGPWKSWLDRITPYFPANIPRVIQIRETEWPDKQGWALAYKRCDVTRMMTRWYHPTLNL